MRFEDERYVRVYTRDTVAWLAMRWESRCVLLALFRKVDRAGLLELGDDGIEGLCVALALPLEVVEPGLAGLVKRGTVRMVDTTLTMPNFLHAQECSQSDAARKRAQRERDAARGNMPKPLTEGDRSSRTVTPIAENVTGGHSASQSVTPTLPVLSLPVPSLPVGEAPADAAPATEPVTKVRKRSTERATRLPEGWTPKPETIRRFALKERVDATVCIEPFRLHFQSVGGANALKTDWEKTFMKWVLRDLRHLPPWREPIRVEPEPQYGPPCPPTQEQLDAVAAFIAGQRPRNPLNPLDDPKPKEHA